jgi:hypothetical protein
MIRISKIHHDRLLFALAAGMLMVSGGWGWLHRGDLERMRTESISFGDAATSPRSAGSGVAASPLSETNAVIWHKPVAQSSGNDWLYEVFTPPVIYYHAAAKSFAVTPPLPSADQGTAFGLELLEAKFEFYRLQFAGYFGEPGNYLAAFVAPGQSETWLARRGRRFEQLGLTLQSIEVKKIEVTQDDARPVYDVAAFAVLRDEQTGGEVVLDSRAPKLTDTPLAVLRLADGSPPRAWHEGDSFTDDTATYRIERIQVDPPEVVVARRASGMSQPETRILRPVGRSGDVAARPAQSGKFPAPSGSGLVVAGP